MSTPFLAAAASAATMLTGVEITSAQGQAITSSTSARYSHSPQPPPNSSGGASSTARARAMTAGV